MTISQKGLVKEAMNQFSTDDPLPPAVVNRMQEDDALLSQGQVDLFTSRNKPKIHTGDYKMNVTAGADTVTLSAGVVFDVGGVIFSTDDLADRAFNIPDGTTKYLYAAVADDCGEAVDWQADPIVRNRTVSMTLEDVMVESTPTKMLILKAVKGSAGETPTVTLYANDGLSGGLDGAILPWDSGLTYTQGRCVIGSDYRIYRSRIGANLGNDPTAAGWETNWELLTRDYVTEAQATISDGNVQVCGFFNDLLPEGGAADSLDNIDVSNVAVGQYIIIRNADPDHAITVTHAAGGPGQILDPDEADIELDDVAKLLICRREGTDILVVSKLGSAWGDQTGIGGSDDWYYGDSSDGDLTVSSDYQVSVATDDTDFLISNFNNLTIQTGCAMYPQRRVKCWVCYVAGDLIIDGHLHIDSKGANAAASQLQIDRGVLITASPYSDGADADVFTVSALGGSGGAQTTGSNVAGNNGASQAAGSGGGGSGGAGGAGYGGAGAAGTAYCGGSGGGAGTVAFTGGAGSSNGGAGGNGNAFYDDMYSHGYNCGGGSGNPGGSGDRSDAAVGYAYAGGEGGGGTMFVIVQGSVTIGSAGIISADGDDGGAAGGCLVSAGGGGAGGGVVKLFYKGTLTNNGTIRANGGSGGAATAESINTAGGSGGAGSVAIQQLPII